MKKTAEYADFLDNNPEFCEQIKRFYNYGTAYREMTATEFMKTVITKHYALSDEFKKTEEFKKILKLLK